MEEYVSLIRLKMEEEKKLIYEQDMVDTPSKVADFAKKILSGADREYLLVISISTKSRPLAVEIVAIGRLNALHAQPREIFKHAILNNAAGIVLVHNHPSGDCRPSIEDRAFTDHMRQAGFILGIEVYDHVVIGDGYYSLKEDGNEGLR